MPRVALPHPLPLPGGWPRRVRAAAVHAVALADFALTTALGWAAQNLNSRLRLHAELERLRQEIALLQEEIRIKEAQRRPRYPPAQRLAILELSRGARGRTFLVTGWAPGGRVCALHPARGLE
jgi:hypothetical protein